MTVPELAQAVFKAYHNNEIYSINNFLTNVNEEEPTCFGECDVCSLSRVCLELSTLNGVSDNIAFLRNTKPIYTYIKHNYPEYLL